MMALMMLLPPELRFSDWVSAYRVSSKKKDNAETSRDWLEFFRLTLDTRNQGYGAYNAKWANDWRAELLTIVGGEEGKLLAKVRWMGVWLHSVTVTMSSGRLE